MGTHCQQWMPFWPPFSPAGKRFVKNTSSRRIQLITSTICTVENLGGGLCLFLPKPSLGLTAYQLYHLWRIYAPAYKMSFVIA